MANFSRTIAGLAGKGGITIVAFKRSETGLATVTEEWRGRASISAPATWPVPPDDSAEPAGLLQAQVTFLRPPS